MKYLVIGGAGFIGSNLAENLVKEGHEVIVVDNLSTGSLDNLASIKDKVKFIEAPAMDVLELPELKNLDGIFHLGMPSTTLLYRENKLLIGEAVNEFIKVLELAKRENCRLIYASSSSVYNGNKPPFKEDMPVFIKDFYTEARYLMERLAKLYYDFYQVKSIGLRFFSVYGPHEEAKKDFANLISQFLWEIRAGNQPLLFGDGEQTRDFTWVGDIIDGFMLSMNSDIEYDVFNLGKGECYSLNELVSLLNKILGTNISSTYVKNTFKNYVYETLADTDKAKQGIGFEAKISLKQGIRKLINNG
ncbi:NAD-dependent epimerase/dehydratase family protein [Candidatus Parcubacteria bacterium]|nr:NAD-dependent epimerase/dehydratase family protein [Candidatus Parcubacteria bacterium]